MQVMRIAVVGAGTLLGKTLNEAIAESSLASAEVLLLDSEETSGTLVSGGDEANLIQTVEADSFAGCDFAFFAGTRELTGKYWRDAVSAGACVIDLSGELRDADGAIVRAPSVQDGGSAVDGGRSPAAAVKSIAPNLQTSIVVSAHPATVLLALLTARLQKAAPVRSFFATLLQPASEYGQGALEELHQQTANLLRFQAIPTDVFGVQSAFSLAVSLGADRPISLDESAMAIRRDFHRIVLLREESFMLQVIQAPVFHGCSASIAVELEQPATLEAMEQALSGTQVHVVAAASEFPENIQAADTAEIQVLVRRGIDDATPGETASAAPGRRFWLWVAADNLKLAASNAIECALELNRLRPSGKVQ